MLFVNHSQRTKMLVHIFDVCPYHIQTIFFKTQTEYEYCAKAVMKKEWNKNHLFHAQGMIVHKVHPKNNNNKKFMVHPKHGYLEGVK